MRKVVRIAILTMFVAGVVSTVSVSEGQSKAFAGNDYCGVQHEELVSFMNGLRYDVVNVYPEGGCRVLVDTQYEKHVRVHIDGGKIVAWEELP